MLQRCHVCGKMDESCKPCEYCGWWFCEEHIDPEQHECTGKARQTRVTRLRRKEEGEQLGMWRLKGSYFLEFGLLLLTFFVVFGARASPYTLVQAEQELSRKTLELEPFSIRWFSIYVIPYSSARMENTSLRIVAHEPAYGEFSLMVYALDFEEKTGFLEWWRIIEEYGIYVKPNFTKALYEARDVWRTSATVPIRKPGSFELIYVVLNLNLGRTVKVDVASSLLWLRPGAVNLGYSLDSPGFYAGLPLAILSVFLLVRRVLEGRLPKLSLRWMKLFDSLVFAAILFLPFTLYLSTEKDWDNAIVFLVNSHNPIAALSPESLTIYAIVLQSILLHEYGHFAAARSMGLKAEITGPKEPNVFAATKVTAERTVTVGEYAKIRRMGPVSNLLLIVISLPFILLGWLFTFSFLLLWNLFTLKWNWKEFSTPAGARRIVKDASLFTSLAEKHVERVEREMGVKLDYSLDSLRILGEVSSRLIQGEDPAKPRELVLFTHILPTGSYLGETLVKSLNGKWVEDKNPVGWAIGLDGERIDVFQIAFESIVTPNRFNELFEKLASTGNRTGSSPGFNQEP